MSKQTKSYLPKVRDCIETLMKHGTDRYGKTKAPILVSILDVETRDCPENPKPLDEYFRVTRRGRRSPAGSNLQTDQPTLKTMYALSELTGDNRYADFADTYSAYVMKNLVDDQGFFWWGFHRHYDVFKDTRDGHNPNRAKWGERVFPHEFHAIDINWDRLWTVNKVALTREIEAIWKWHIIDKRTGEPNRHGDGNRGCDFTMTGGGCIEAFAFMYARTKDPVWLDRAKLVSNYYWERRDPSTNLIPDRPNAGKERFDGSCFVTSTTGLYCRSLLKAFEWTGEACFKDQALAFLTAYATLGYDEKTGKYWGALKMDGSHIPGPRVYTDNVDSAKGYAAAQPRGHLDLWGPYVAGYQYPLVTALAYAEAYQVTKDPLMLTTAKRFADWIKNVPPGTVETENTWYKAYSEGPGKKGAYADQYGKVITFLSQLHALTNETSYLDHARELADEAVEKLYHNGLFRGHPAKPYYETMDGVGNLLHSLLVLEHQLTN